MIYKIIIPGRPVPKGRPRWNKSTGAIYTPPETKRYEKTVYIFAKSQMTKMLKGDVDVRIKVYTKRKMDIDNVAKSILDGLIGAAFEDDKQVKRLEIEMLDKVDEEQVIIEIGEIENDKKRNRKSKTMSDD
ncbi:endodeoxyribonuclease RusA [Caldicellulosiruptor owensensis OL]|uniref:Endodeoxyribonuclease RusA n=1 Tax=Caldicellulosiruptor owensensis (strain ATCC 700167 / DSM 13100 / OL) TaxID=632518 RepID=E4Q617_CALOW|nr:RusA family crossover junction endodeoxyribonuclease [Caldicellulosiruptor owensensis]ADQ04391.1 endodeoxyribonuclease RusA [Caldicellulosiruptor owensensis OL]